MQINICYLELQGDRSDMVTLIKGQVTGRERDHCDDNILQYKTEFVDSISKLMGNK